MRDRDRAAVYGVENEVISAMGDDVPYKFYGSMLDLRPDVKFGRVSDAQDYVDQVWRLEECLGESPRVRTRKGKARAHYQYGRNEIALPDARWALCGMVVVHEMSHAMVDVGVGHGEKFQKKMVELVRNYVSPECSLLLMDGFARI